MMAPSVKCLQCKLDDLHSSYNTYLKKSQWWLYTPAGKVGTGRSLRLVAQLVWPNQRVPGSPETSPRKMMLKMGKKGAQQ